MPIRPFLPDSHSFDPEDIAKMSAAFEAALRKLGLADRSDPAAMAVAKLITTATGRQDRIRQFSSEAAAVKWLCRKEP